MSRWAEAWRASCSPSTADARPSEPISSGCVSTVTPLRVETVAIDISTCRISVEVRHGPGGIESIAMTAATDPVRTKAAAIVNGCLAQGEALEAQALRLIAMTDLVAGLIRLEEGGAT